MTKIPGPDRQRTGRAAPVPQQLAQTVRSAGRTVNQMLSLLLLVFVTVMLVLFTVFNTQTVQVSLVFGEAQAPLWGALLIAALLGALITALFDAVMRVRRGRHNPESWSASRRTDLRRATCSSAGTCQP